MPLTTTKKNRNDIKEIAKHSKELFDYMLHICNILADPPKYKLHEHEMQGFKKDLALTLKKIDENNGLILGHLAYEDIKHEAFSTTFKIDQYFDFHVYIQNKSRQDKGDRDV